jgi:acetyl-CoA carboxylase carboxyl transferase alpha subunit
MSLFGSNKEKTWAKIEKARDPQRPKPQDFIAALVDDLMVMSGDRLSGEDKTILGGVGSFRGHPVTVIGTQKGRNLNENLEFRFGMPLPSGYRKALRLMQQAEKFNRPIITFIDTPGAYCGIESEEKGISQAIAVNLFEMISLKVPVIAVVTGEGGSGGALALSIANRIFMMENSVYSVISPEGCASILFHDSSKAPEAAEALQITSDKVYETGIIDQIIAEKVPLVSKNKETFSHLGDVIEKELNKLRGQTAEQLKVQRMDKFQNIGSQVV